jgi:hypothetical protein
MLSGTVTFDELIVIAVAGRMRIHPDNVKLDKKTRFLPEEHRAVREVLISGEPTGVFYDMSVPVTENREIDTEAMVENENRKITEIVDLLTRKGY